MTVKSMGYNTVQFRKNRCFAGTYTSIFGNKAELRVSQAKTQQKQVTCFNPDVGGDMFLQAVRLMLG